MGTRNPDRIWAPPLWLVEGALKPVRLAAPVMEGLEAPEKRERVRAAAAVIELRWLLQEDRRSLNATGDRAGARAAWR